MAIRDNVSDLYGMKKSVTSFHNCDIANEEERHQFFLRLLTSWCMWWSNKLTPGQNKINVERNYLHHWPLSLC